MCLMVFEWRPDTPVCLRLAANRDEYHARPALPLHRWHDAPAIVGGRDERAGGSWLAAHAQGRLAAVTNVRNGFHPPPTSGPSRGALVRSALETPLPLADWLASLDMRPYAWCNLLVCDGETLWHLHHGPHDTHCTQVGPGIHGLSNADLNTPWPKLVRLRERFGALLRDKPDDDTAQFALLGDQHRPDATHLPDTGIGEARERQLGTIFIAGEHYGTRASTLVKWSREGRNGQPEITLHERRFGPDATLQGDVLQAVTLSSCHETAALSHAAVTDERCPTR